MKDPNQTKKTATAKRCIVRYGAIAGDFYSCDRRSTADRIRKVVRLHREAGGWCGPRTLALLVDDALARRDVPPWQIVADFRARGLEADLREINAILAQVIDERDAARRAAGGTK